MFHILLRTVLAVFTAPSRDILDRDLRLRLAAWQPKRVVCLGYPPGEAALVLVLELRRLLPQAAVLWFDNHLPAQAGGAAEAAIAGYAADLVSVLGSDARIVTRAQAASVAALVEPGECAGHETMLLCPPEPALLLAALHAAGLGYPGLLHDAAAFAGSRPATGLTVRGRLLGELLETHGTEAAFRAFAAGLE